MPTPTDDAQAILRHLDQIAVLADRLVKNRDLADQTETAAHLHRLLIAIRQVVQPSE